MILRWLHRLRNRIQPSTSAESAEPRSAPVSANGSQAPVASFVRGIVSTLPDELGCDECFEAMDRFAELALAGEAVADLLPRVHAHLQRCPDCHEEYQALVAALQTTA